MIFQQEGKVYCCDMCAAGPNQMMPRMMFRMLPMAAVLGGIGLLIGTYSLCH